MFVRLVDEWEACVRTSGAKFSKADTEAASAGGTGGREEYDGLASGCADWLKGQGETPNLQRK